MPISRLFSEDAVLDAISGGVIVLDENECIVKWNAWIANASGYTAAEVCGKSLAQVFSDVEIKRLTSAIRTALRSNASTAISHALNSSPLPLRTRSGRALLHDINVTPVGDPPDVACLVFITDVTMATRREQYLRDQQTARYNSIVESAPDIILSVNDVGAVQFANHAAALHFGYESKELVDKQVATLFDAKSDWSSLWRAALDESSSFQSRELIGLRKDGSSSHLEASAARWRLGSQSFVTFIMRDVTERLAMDSTLRASEAAARASAAALAELNETLELRVEQRTAQLLTAEQALRQSQKMEAIGQLTGGIAHDFNNLLQGITGSLQVIQKLIAAGRISELDRFISGARESATRAATLTHRLLAFSRQQPVDPRALNANKLVASMEELLRRTIGETVQLKYVTGNALWLVRCDVNQLENAILNLAINARDAMPNGGTLTFETANIVLDSAEARLREVARGEYVRLIVRDTGVGMPPEVRSRIFEPFYTTKPIGKGTGLGLSMIYGFVKQSGGSILVESEEGKGASIEICLPRHCGDLDVQAEQDAHRPEKRAGTGEVVLVVEDEAVVRLLVVDVLKDLGYYALETDNGTSATRILQSPQRVDLLIADLGLPDISGRQVADVAIACRKDLKVLFMTGYAEKAAGNSFLEPGMEIITKPFSMDVLASRIRDIIETKSSYAPIPD